MTAVSTSRWRSARPLWMACGVYLALRVLVLATNFDAVSLPTYELMGIGLLGKLGSEGWGGVGLVNFYDNCGGPIVGGLLAVPLYGLFGDSYLTLKLVPLLLGLGTLIMIWWVLERSASRRAAILAVLLFALTPPTLVKYSMLAKGNHFECLFFQLATWVLFLKAHSSAAKPRWFLLGSVAAGFSVFVSMDCMFLVASLAAVHLAIRGARKTARDLRTLAPGFLLGLAPLAWVQFASPGGIGGFLRTSFDHGAANPVERFFTRLVHLWTGILPHAGVFEDLGPFSGRVAEALYLGAFLLAWSSLAFVLARGVLRAFASRADESAQGEAQRLEHLFYAPLVLYLPLFSVAYASSAVEFDVFAKPVEVGRFRYLVPHFLFSSLIIAVAGARWMAGRGAVRTLGVVLATTALSTTLWTLPIVDWSFSKVGSGARHPGYDFERYGGLVLKDLEWDPAQGGLEGHGERVAARMAAFPIEARNHVWFGVAFRAAQVELARAGRSTGSPLDVGPLLRVLDLDGEHPIDLARGVGCALRRMAERKHAAWNETARWLALLDESADPRVAYVFEGLCLSLGPRLEATSSYDLALNRELRTIVPPARLPPFLRGQGIACGRLAGRGIVSDRWRLEEWVERVPSAEAADFWFGFGCGLAEESEGTRAPLAQAARLKDESRAALLRGVGAGLRHDFGLEPARARTAPLRAELDEQDRAALDRGLDWSNYPLPSPNPESGD